MSGKNTNSKYDIFLKKIKEKHQYLEDTESKAKQFEINFEKAILIHRKQNQCYAYFSDLPLDILKYKKHIEKYP